MEAKGFVFVEASGWVHVSKAGSGRRANTRRKSVEMLMNGRKDNPEEEADLVRPRLLLGGLADGLSLDPEAVSVFSHRGSLESGNPHGITHIVNVSDFSYATPPGVQKLHLVEGVEPQSTAASIFSHFESVSAFIAESIGADFNSCLLVHCDRGVCRAPTFVCAYIMLAERCSAAVALASIMDKRSMCQPSSEFLSALVMWNDSLTERFITPIRGAPERVTVAQLERIIRDHQTLAIQGGDGADSDFERVIDI